MKSRRRWIVATCLVVLLGLLAVWRLAFHGQRPDLIVWPPTTGDAALDLLERPVDLACEDEPFFLVVRRLSALAPLPVELDFASCPPAPFSPAKRVSGDYRQVPLGAVLRDVLDQADVYRAMVVGVRADRILLTSQNAWLAGLNNYTVELHSLGPLLAAMPEYDFERRIGELPLVLQPDSWNFRNGNGDVQPVPGGLVVTQTLQGQRSLRLLLAALAQCQLPETDSAPLWIDPPPTPQNLAVAAALRRPIDIELDGVGLDEAARQWSRELAIPIDIDWSAIRDDGRRKLAPLSAQMHGVQLDSALRTLLGGPYGLTWLIRHGRLRITSKVVAEMPSNVALRVYPTSGLLAARDASGSLSNLEVAVNDLVAQSAWRLAGGPAEACQVPGALLVLQTEEGHRDVERLLAELRQRQSLAGDGPPVHWTPARRRLEEALGQPADLHLVERPLREVVEQLAGRLKLNVWLDRHALDDMALPLDHLVTIDARRQPLEQALRATLDPLGLECDLPDEVLVITSRAEAEYRLQVCVHRVARLVWPPVGDWGPYFNDPDRLTDLIQTFVAPESWPALSGPISLRALDDLLPIAQTRLHHQQIAQLLACLVEATASDPDRDASWTVGLTEAEYSRLSSWPPREIQAGEEDSPEPRLTRVHRVAWLIRAEDVERLADLVRGVSVRAWSDYGGPGEASEFRGLLVVRQSAGMQARVDRLLAQFKDLARREANASAGPVCLDEAADERIGQVLERPVHLTAVNRTVRDVLLELGQQAGETIDLDPELTLAWSDRKVNLLAAGVPLADVLDAIAPGQLAPAIMRGRLRLVPLEEATSSVTSCVYPVGRLDVALRAAGRPASEADHMPLPWHLKPTRSPYGRLPLEDPGGKGIPGDNLLWILGEQVGPLLLVRQPVSSQRATAAALRLLERSVAASVNGGLLVNAPALSQPVTLSFEQLPLEDALRQLAEQCGRGFLVEGSAWSGVEDVRRHRVSLELDQVPLADALGQLLPASDQPAVFLRGETVVVSGRQAADAEWTWQTFDVRSLRDVYGEQGELRLARFASFVDPLSWRSGPDAVLGCLPGSLTAYHARGTLGRIERLLEMLAAEPDLSRLRLRENEQGELQVRVLADAPEQVERVAQRWIQLSRDHADADVRLLAILLLVHLDLATSDWPTLDWHRWLVDEVGQLSRTADPNSDRPVDEERLFALCLAVRRSAPHDRDMIEPLARLLTVCTDRQQRDVVLRTLVRSGPVALGRLEQILSAGSSEDHLTAALEIPRARVSARDALPYLMGQFERLDASQLLSVIAELDPTGRHSHRLLDLWARDSNAMRRERARQVRPLIRGVFGDPIDN
ncbi:MAG: hypothetical protein J5I93_13915 [Pirellulaceae bacterium]|nr:hypothetical protein [Pirellulaceae bacterium]